MKRLALAAAVALTGCVETKPIDQMGYAERQELAREILQRCKALGIKDGSPQMDQCIEVEVQKEVSTRQARADGMARFGAGLQAAGNNYSNAMRANRPVTCTTYYNTTRCY